MYNSPIAYFLTFTVRGSWRHGDSRGSWYRQGQFIPSEPNVVASQNNAPPHLFSEEEREIIGKALEEQCQLKQWTLYEKTVQHNHVHIVLTAPELLPEVVMKALKAKVTFRLRQGGWVSATEKIWTQHGSTRYLFDEEALEAACNYVRNNHKQKLEWSEAE